MMWIAVCIIAVIIAIVFLTVKKLRKRDILLEYAQSGEVEAQYLLGQYYLKAGDIDSAVYWLCLAGERNGDRRALSLLIEIKQTGDPEFHRRLNSAREKVKIV